MFQTDSFTGVTGPGVELPPELSLFTPQVASSIGGDALELGGQPTLLLLSSYSFLHPSHHRFRLSALVHNVLV